MVPIFIVFVNTLSRARASERFAAALLLPCLAIAPLPAPCRAAPCRALLRVVAFVVACCCCVLLLCVLCCGLLHCVLARPRPRSVENWNSVLCSALHRKTDRVRRARSRISAAFLAASRKGGRCGLRTAPLPCNKQLVFCLIYSVHTFLRGLRISE